MKRESDQLRIFFTLAVPDKTGAAKMARAYGEALLRRGFTVTVLHGPPPTGLELSEGIVPELVKAGIQTRFVQSLDRPWRRLAFQEVTALVREGAGGAIVGFNQKDRPIALAAANRLHIPGIIAGGNQHKFYGSAVLKWLKRKRYGWYVKRYTDLAICTSEKVLREFELWFHVSTDRLVLLKNGIPLEPYGRANLAESAKVHGELGLRYPERMLISVGRLDVQKGYDLLVQAFAKLPEPLRLRHRLFIVGGVTHSPTSRKFAQDLERSISSFGLESRITLLGWRDDIPRLLGAADCYVHAARWEGPPLPLAAMEAMASGLPALITDCSGHPDGFRIGIHGEIAKAGSADSLTSALRRLIESPNNVPEIAGAACRRLIESEYSIEVIGDRFVDHVTGAFARKRDNQVASR